MSAEGNYMRKHPSSPAKDPAPFAYVNPNMYIQHNLQVGPGPAGVAALVKNMPPSTSVNAIRILEDGNYNFAHTQYNFFGARIRFDIFRCEDSLGIYDLFRIEKGRIAEHWDTLEAIPPRDQWRNSNGKF
jgi:predicted SnoaL-like aldol condensation-catalyzing enzyme